MFNSSSCRVFPAGKVRGVPLLLFDSLLPPPTHTHTCPEGKNTLKTPTKFHYSHCIPIETSCLAVVIAPVSFLFYLHTLCTEFN